MDNIYYISDFSNKDANAGGGEMVDYNLYTLLGIPLIKTSDRYEVSSNNFYIISNTWFIDPINRKKLIDLKNYIIMEHDYRIHPTRQPHLFKDYLFPSNELINLDLYKSAKFVIAQTNDHHEGLRKNFPHANYYTLHTSIWSDIELDTLNNFSNTTKKTSNFALLGNQHPTKGLDIALSICNSNKWKYDILPNLSLLDFYNKLSEYPVLLYTPRVKESYCRLIIEAKCLNTQVITNKVYGVISEPYYELMGKELIEYLRIATKDSIRKIKELINS